MVKQIDACGLSCPEPVLMLKRVIDDSSEIEILVDSQVCVENCTRFAASKGFDVYVDGQTGLYTMRLTKSK